MEEFKAKLPQQDGLLLRPQVRKKLRLSLQKKTSTGTKPLPPPSKRGRKKQLSDYRNRVGRKAQSLRKVQIQCTCTPLLYSTLLYNVYIIIVLELAYMKINLNTGMLSQVILIVIVGSSTNSE